MKPRVLITNEIPKEGVLYLKARYRVHYPGHSMGEKRILSEVRSCHGILSTLSEPINERIMDAAPHLMGVSNCAVGYNNIDLPAARRRGVQVTNTPGVLTESTADLAWALLLSCARRVPEGERLVRAGRFKGANLLMLRGLDLNGKTLGIYGCGRIGQAVARRGRGWDMEILYHNRRPLSSSIERNIHGRYVSFPQLLQKSDYLVVTAPLNDETRGRFSLREFKSMKSTGVFINIGRGPIHKERDLAQALQKGYLFYAGLDVYEREPVIEPGLLSSDRVTLLPHIGSASVETRKTMSLLAAKNLDLILRGKKPLNPVT